MTWNSTLQRKTPLRAKTGFKPSQCFKQKSSSQLHKDDNKKPSKGSRSPQRAKTERGGLIERLDTAFSLYIRLRDAMPGGRTRCISCGREFPFEQMQAGHYHSRRSYSTRWDELNVHSQCSVCNCNQCGNIVGYTPNLIAKIGQERFDALRIRANQIRKWSDDELKCMIRHYIAEARRLSKEKCITINI